ncbi:MAG: NAD(P)H-hydrate dehydratase [Candidatus Eremiobacteraeota bacterium]|nr:NAD(P)H-hydrate dehydratase [Candidatus Eremiobacteraeota bacterium]
MTAVLTPQQMRDVDAVAIAQVGEVTLMRNAGKAIAEAARRRSGGSGRIVAFAGPGNNGGDAFGALANLRPDHECFIYAAGCANPSPARTDAEQMASAAGVTILPMPRSQAEAARALSGADLALDGLFGTGARLPISDAFVPVVAALNAGDADVIAIDIPSGVDALTGGVTEPAVRADVTVTLGALKPGLLLGPARDCVGELWCADIGIPNAPISETQPLFAALDDDAFLALLPKRADSSDKRSSGAPLIIAGSEQFTGAAILCAYAAARAGAGYVTVATAQAAAPILRAHLVEQVVTTIRTDVSVGDAIDALVATAGHASSIGIGPGLGLDDRTGEIVRGFLRATDLPFVADAGALFHFSKHLDLLDTPRAVITPHAGEFARLSGKGTLKEGERVQRLREFVDRTHCTTLLKGRSTLVYDGITMHINTTGTPALATAGTGDVLTGIIATLLSQGLTPVDAARAGAYWHGLAGKLCARNRAVGVIAGDLPDMLASAIPFAQPQAALRRIF